MHATCCLHYCRFKLILPLILQLQLILPSSMSYEENRGHEMADSSENAYIAINSVIIPIIAAVGLLLNVAQLVLQGRPRIIARHQSSIYFTALSVSVVVRFLVYLLERMASGVMKSDKRRRVICRTLAVVFTT